MWPQSPRQWSAGQGVGSKVVLASFSLCSPFKLLWPEGSPQGAGQRDPSGRGHTHGAACPSVTPQPPAPGTNPDMVPRRALCCHSWCSGLCRARDGQSCISPSNQFHMHLLLGPQSSPRSHAQCGPCSQRACCHERDRTLIHSDITCRADPGPAGFQPHPASGRSGRL